MSEKIKNLSSITKLLYLFTFILFIAWVIPTIASYYNNLKAYETNIQELKMVSEKYGVSTQTQKFTENSFQKNTELLFEKVEVKSLGEELYEIDITIKKEDLKNFHTFIETISLRYYVEIKDTLEFTTENEIIKVKMVLKAF